MSLRAQAKVLRALQEGEIEKVGGGGPIKVDVRVIAATNRDLEADVRDRRLPRGSVLPPERGAHPRAAPAPTARRHGAAGGAFPGALLRRERPAPAHAAAPTPWLCCSDLPWPGNVRELHNAVERLAIMAAGAGDHSRRPARAPGCWMRRPPARRCGWRRRRRPASLVSGGGPGPGRTGRGAPDVSRPLTSPTVWPKPTATCRRPRGCWASTARICTRRSRPMAWTSHRTDQEGRRDMNRYLTTMLLGRGC